MRRFITLITLALAFVLIPPGCGKSVGPSGFPLKITVSETLENRNELIAKVYDDLKALHKSGIPVREYRLNIEETIQDHETRNNIDRLLCTEGDIFSGEYLMSLTVRYIDLDLRDTWKKYAAYAYFCDAEPDPGPVKEYLLNEENKDILSMFVGYWLPEFNSEEELKRNSAVAELYGKYIIDNYGVSELLTCAAKDYVNEWLSELGITYSFSDEYAELIDTFTYTEDYNYDLIVRTDQNITYYITPPEYDGKDVSRLREFLFNSYVHVDKILQYIEKEAPDYYERTKDNLLSADVRMYFDRTMLTAWGGVTMGTEIRSRSYEVFAHEIVHVIIPVSTDTGTAHRWRFEGIANYLGYVWNNTFSESLLATLRRNVERILKDPDLNDLPGFEKELVTELQKTVFDEGFSYGDYYRLFAKLELKWGDDYEDYLSVAESYKAAYSHLDDEENSQLSYNTATIFVEYLIEKYGLNNFFKYCIDNASFEESFGTSFDKALTMWKG